MFRSRREKPPVRRPHVPSDNYGSYAFRRSRTLTGSVSSTVASATESRSQLKSPRLKEHELKERRNRLLVSLVGVVALSGLLVWLLDQYVVQADEVVTIGSINRTLKADDYKKTVDEYLSARPLERFRFALNEERFDDFVQQKRPEVATVAIEDGKGLVAAKLNLKFRQPVVVWRVGDKRHYVDASGQVFSANYYTEPKVSVKDESGINPDDVNLVASSRLLRFLGQVISGVNDSKIGKVSEVIVPSGALRQLDIKLDNHPYIIKTHMDRDTVGQVADIVSAVRYLDRKGVTPEYIDVRVSGKAFYR